MLSAHIAVAKVAKYASSDSGDTVEIAERAKGGVSIILADGQGSGRSAKSTSMMVVNKAVTLLADGARDGAVARTAHDFLYAAKHGKVSATLTIVSVDLFTKTLLISRNSHTPVIIISPQGQRILGKQVSPIGVHRVMKPEISEIPLTAGTVVITYTDGIMEAGKAKDAMWSEANIIQECKGYSPSDMDYLAKHLLNEAQRLDDGRPRDDMTVVAVGIDAWEADSKVRTMCLTLPF